MEARKGKTPEHPFHFVAHTFKFVLLGTIVISCLFAASNFKISDYFPIKTVRVYGINRVDHKEVEELLVPLVNRGFFTINVEYIRDRLLQMPWVADIFVRRNWPDRVEVTVVEKNAVARWNQESLLSEGGELFAPSQETYPPNLPTFVGPNGQQIFMYKYFIEMNRLLAPLHVKISYLELTPFLTWKLKLDNGIAMQIGHKDILTRLGHFVKVYPKIVREHAADVEYVDLRYPNGVAVRWKTTVKA